MWRPATPQDDPAIVQMCLELNEDDPGPHPVSGAQVRRTLEALRREPLRGRAVVLEVDGRPAGYALLISFWSNELGGELCDIDELFVARAHRSRGYGQALFAAIERGELWPSRPIGMSLGVRTENARARRLYERLGFEPAVITMIRRLH